MNDAPNRLTLGNEGLDEDIAALTPGDACYVRARITLDSADRCCRTFTIDEVSFDGEAKPAKEDKEGEDEGESEGPEEQVPGMDEPTDKAPGITVVMKGHKP